MHVATSWCPGQHCSGCLVGNVWGQNSRSQNLRSFSPIPRVVRRTSKRVWAPARRPAHPPTHPHGLVHPLCQPVCVYVRFVCAHGPCVCGWEKHTFPSTAPSNPTAPTHPPTPPHPHTHAHTRPRSRPGHSSSVRPLRARAAGARPLSPQERDEASSPQPTHFALLSHTHTHTQHRPPPLAPHPTPHHHTQHP